MVMVHVQVLRNVTPWVTADLHLVQFHHTLVGEIKPPLEVRVLPTKRGPSFTGEVSLRAGRHPALKGLV